MQKGSMRDSVSAQDRAGQINTAENVASLGTDAARRSSTFMQQLHASPVVQAITRDALNWPPNAGGVRGELTRAAAGLPWQKAASGLELGSALSAAHDIYKNGAHAVNSMDYGTSLALMLQAAGRLNPIAASAAGGWQVGRAIGDALPRSAQNAIGGTVAQGLYNLGITKDLPDVPIN